MEINAEDLKILTGVDLDGNDGVTKLDKQQGWFLQVSLGALVIFLVIATLFNSRARQDLAAAKGQLSDLADKISDLDNTDKGKELLLKEKALIELQKQRLLNALQKVEEESRSDFALNRFLIRGTDGKLSFSLADLLSGKTIKSEQFKEGCARAKWKLSDLDKLAKDWADSILIMEGMKFYDVGVRPEANEPEKVAQENKTWLFTEINNRIKALYSDVVNMQQMAFSKLLEYYRENPGELEGSKVSELINRYASGADQDKDALLKGISSGLVDFVKNGLKTQNVEFLKKD